jgi:hypothetical protein
MASDVLPADWVMLLHSITGVTGPQIVERGIALRLHPKQAIDCGMSVTIEIDRFIKFISTDIFRAAGCRRSRPSTRTRQGQLKSDPLDYILVTYLKPGAVA